MSGENVSKRAAQPLFACMSAAARGAARLLRKSKTKLDPVLLRSPILLAVTALAHNPLAVEVRKLCPQLLDAGMAVEQRR